MLYQLDHSIDRRDNRMPVLSDINSVGEMDLYADKVLFLYREDYYNFDADNKDKAEVCVAKSYYLIGQVELSHKGGGIFEDIHPQKNDLNGGGYQTEESVQRLINALNKND